MIASPDRARRRAPRPPMAAVQSAARDLDAPSSNVTAPLLISLQVAGLLALVTIGWQII